MSRKLTVVQTLPALESGGVERGTVEVAAELVRRGHRAIVVSGGGRLAASLTAAGAEHVELPIGRKSPFTLRHLPALVELLRATRADILHTRSRMPGWLSWLAWRRVRAQTGLRFITGVHGPYSVNPYSAIMTRGERVIAISGFIRDYLFENYPRLERGRVALIPRGVSPEEFPRGYRPAADWLADWRARYPMLAGRHVLTLPARITRWKGHQDFLEILSVLRQRGALVHGLIAGGVDTRRRSFQRELERKVALLDLRDHVTFLGHRSDLREVMAVSDVVLSLAREPEAFGRTALEALSLGVPVVAYDHGGASEVLGAMFRDGLVQPLDINTAADRVRSFLKSAPPVGANTHYTLQRLLDQTLDLYRELARGSQSA